MNILIILLGCNISHLLNDRIQSALGFANAMTYDNNITWLLSGGIKDKNKDTVTEAEKMGKFIMETNYNYGLDYDWSYVYDIGSTNTAENFIAAKNLLEESNYNYEEVIVVTSDFHYERANKIATKIITEVNLNWVLSPKEEPTSRHWEGIHIQNVELDVDKAKSIKNKEANLVFLPQK